MQTQVQEGPKTGLVTQVAATILSSAACPSFLALLLSGRLLLQI
jgi:hypothetical protein